MTATDPLGMVLNTIQQQNLQTGLKYFVRKEAETIIDLADMVDDEGNLTKPLDMVAARLTTIKSLAEGILDFAELEVTDVRYKHTD